MVCGLAFGLLACAHRSGGPTAPVAASPPSPEELTTRDAFTCASGQRLATEFDSTRGTLALSIDDGLVRLQQVPSASGTKFSNGEVEFWSEGDVASLEIDGVRTECEREISR